MTRFLSGLVAMGLLVGGAGRGKADYLFTTLEGILASGINDSVQVVGWYASPYDSFLYSGGTYTPIKVPTSSPSSAMAWGINNAGQIVGQYIDADGFHGFLFSGGSYTRLDVSGPPGITSARGIDNVGQIVGYYTTGQPGGPTLGFLRSGGSYTTIAVPGSTSTWVTGMNDHNELVGYYAGVGLHGFLLNGGSYTTIDVPGSLTTTVTGINNAGQIVGYYALGPTAHGFLLSDGIYTTIDVPGAMLTGIWGINNGGQLVGDYVDAGGSEHAFLATPIPEPSTLVLLGIATFGVLCWLWHRPKGIIHNPP